ncbi:hypothetical protein BDF14DRAFT_1835259 [Spinellus fusiger]|nr:hypothetical protein BDF14DRAFT_1835259 [Spinellus fusiger]
MLITSIVCLLVCLPILKSIVYSNDIQDFNTSRRNSKENRKFYSRRLEQPLLLLLHLVFSSFLLLVFCLVLSVPKCLYFDSGYYWQTDSFAFPAVSHFLLLTTVLSLSVQTTLLVSVVVVQVGFLLFFVRVVHLHMGF